MELADLKCEPPAPGAKPLSPQEAAPLAVAVPSWALQEGSIERTFRFKDFREAMRFVTRVAELAEWDNHHPDILIRYNTVTLVLSTHKIGGLSRNDFILAAKIDRLGSA